MAACSSAEHRCRLSIGGSDAAFEFLVAGFLTGSPGLWLARVSQGIASRCTNLQFNAERHSRLLRPSLNTNLRFNGGRRLLGAFPQLDAEGNSSRVRVRLRRSASSRKPPRPSSVRPSWVLPEALGTVPGWGSRSGAFGIWSERVSRVSMARASGCARCTLRRNDYVHSKRGKSSAAPGGGSPADRPME
jgi:hypothetical protein